ncbi:MAG: hypothetical protein HZB54_10005 [Deltaproteobacteria bacterium]|nr:hypothetical protein [Deltaproteobacteria bacterium]
MQEARDRRQEAGGKKQEARSKKNFSLSSIILLLTSNFLPLVSNFWLLASSILFLASNFMPLVPCRRRYIFFIIMLVILFIPARAKGVEVDQYSFNRLKFNIDLSYEEYRYNSKGIKEEYSTFQQRYSLAVTGKLIDRRLLIYEAAIEFDEKTTDTRRTSGAFRQSAESAININNYMLKTTVLPKSSIPLTLYANRNVSDTTYSNEITTDNYGLDWMLWFITLPTTRLTLNQQYTQSIDRDEEAISYGIDLSKNIGPTRNKIGYSAGDTKDSIMNSGSEYSNITFSNITALPMDTDFHLGMVEDDRMSFSKDNTQDYHSSAGSVGLITKPTKIFSQQYNYTFLKSDQRINNDKQLTDNEYFEGNVNFNPTEGLSTFANMTSATYNSTASSKSTTTESRFVSTGASYKYRINTEWSAAESVSYSNSESTSRDPVTGKRERNVVDASSALNYLKRLTWANSFSAGGSLGYHKEWTKPEQDIEGLSYGLNTGLSKINLTYAHLSSSYAYSSVISYVGRNIENQTFYTTANSSYLTYLPAMVSYNYHTLNSYIDSEDATENTVTAEAKLLYFNYLPVEASYKHYTLVRPAGPPSDQEFAYLVDKEENSFNVKANLTYFRNTVITAYTTYSDYMQSVVEKKLAREEISSAWETGINGSHTRVFLAGMLGLSAGYVKTLYENRGSARDIINDTINIYYKGSYNKRLGRNMVWKLQLERNDTTTNGLRDIVDSMETALFYRLRAWFLSAEYRLSETTRESVAFNNNYTEEKWMLRVSRSFVRIF